MKYIYDTFKEYDWQYITDTHSITRKSEVLMDIPPATEFRIQISRFQPGEYADPHTHEWEHAMYIINGTGRVVIDGEEGIVKKGMLAFVPKNTSHAIYNIGRGELVVWGVSGPPKTEAGWAQLKKKE